MLAGVDEARPVRSISEGIFFGGIALFEQHRQRIDGLSPVQVNADEMSVGFALRDSACSRRVGRDDIDRCAIDDGARGELCQR